MGWAKSAQSPIATIGRISLLPRRSLSARQPLRANEGSRHLHGMQPLRVHVDVDVGPMASTAEQSARGGAWPDDRPMTGERAEGVQCAIDRAFRRPGRSRYRGRTANAVVELPELRERVVQIVPSRDGQARRSGRERRRTKLDHPLTAPTARPETIQRCSRKKSTRIGSVIRMAIAAKSDQGVLEEY